ncbi:Uncharacterised protein [uncultured archaeon]|nr:Uncharacterised protein [uncultured archaeon]
MKKRPGFVGPLLILSIGLILLFNNMGLARWDIWGSLWHYWPVILILSGIQILARNAESDVMYFVAVLISILVISGTVLLAWNGYPPPGRMGEDVWGFVYNNIHGGGFNFAKLDGSTFDQIRATDTDTSELMIFSDSKYGYCL